MDDDFKYRFPHTVYPGGTREFEICRTILEAQNIVRERGMPEFISFDHDLGGDDTAIVFLKWLAYEYWDGKSPIPDYRIHSANPIGQKNIESFMRSWRKSLDL